jgi:arsenate reductase (thioredoxin)
VNISELAESAGVTTWTVRWYESRGVLPPSRRSANGYRAYQPSDVALLRLVVTLRRLGLRPDDAGRAAQGLLAGEVDAEIEGLLAGQLATIAHQRADLERLETEIRDLQHTIGAARAASLEEDPAMSDQAPIRVLFLCTGNSARSQMAEALLEQAGGEDFEVESAGTEPKGVNPYTIRVLDESGLDWSGARSKAASDFVGQHWDYVITVCDRARQACPVFPGQYNTMHWGLEDPAEVEGTDEERLAAFRRTKVELAMRLRPFITLARRAAGREQPVTLA